MGASKSLHLTLRLSTTKSSSHHMQGMSALRHGCNCKTGKTSMQRFPTFFRKTQQDFGNTHTHTDATSRKRVRATQTHIPPATPYNTSVKTREGISSNKRRCSTKSQTSGFPPRRSRERRKCHANIRFPKNGNFKPIQSTLYMHTETVATLGHLHFGLERMVSRSAVSTWPLEYATSPWQRCSANHHVDLPFRFFLIFRTCCIPKYITKIKTAGRNYNVGILQRSTSFSFQGIRTSPGSPSAAGPAADEPAQLTPRVSTQLM